MFEEREKIEDDILIKGCEGYNMYVCTFFLSMYRCVYRYNFCANHQQSIKGPLKKHQQQHQTAATSFSFFFCSLST